MDFSVKTGAPAAQRTACAILPLFDERLTGAARELDAASGGLIRRLVRSGAASSKLGSTLLVPTPGGGAAQQWLLVGCGKAADFDAKKLCRALASAVGALKDKGVREAVSYVAGERPSGVTAYYAARLAAETVRGAVYRFDEMKSDAGNGNGKDRKRLARFGLAVGDAADVADTRRGIAHGVAIA